MKKIILTILFSFSLLLGQKVYWVDMYNGSDAGNGSSTAPFKTIHKVLESNSYLTSGQVDTVKVMPSVNTDNPNGYYDFKDEGTLYTSSSRDFVLIGVAGADSTLLDAQSTNRHMYIDDGQSNKTKFIGITFQNGYDTNNGGGAIFLSNGSDIQFIDCVFKNNISRQYSGGGAVVAHDGSTPSFTSCTFEDNRIAELSSGNEIPANNGFGGAVSIKYPHSKDCLLYTSPSPRDQRGSRMPSSA